MVSALRRGDVVVAALAGDYGKPRPAIVVQNDELVLQSVLLCPLSSDVQPPGRMRILLEPSVGNGLRVTSEVMIDKITAAPHQRIGQVIGRVRADELALIDQRLAFVLGLG